LNEIIGSSFKKTKSARRKTFKLRRKKRRQLKKEIIAERSRKLIARR
jgi:hypothetical protein